MAYNGIIGANCISKIFKERLFDSISPESENDLQLGVLLDTIDQLPDCTKLFEEGKEPLEPGKVLNESGELQSIPKKPRKLSKYQQFMSTCAKKENGKSFTECVIEWKRNKESTQSVSQ